jgi:hypothetical protein
MRRLLLLILFLSLIRVTSAQFKNILLDPGTAENKPGEPSIAINLDDPKIIVAASALSNVYYTANRGLSWEKSILASPFGVYGNPAVISDYKGNFFYFHRSDPTGKNWASEEILDRILVQESNDAGVTWSEGVSIGLNHPKDQVRERAVVDRKGNVVVAWTEFDKYGSEDPGCKSNILLSSSSNGKKWSKPIQISQNSGDCKGGANTATGAIPTVTADGSKVFVAWSNQNKIFLDRSFDGGKTWLTNDITVVQQPSGWNFTIPGLNQCNILPVLVCDNTKKGNFSDVLYMVWADQSDGESNTDIWFMRSVNYGDNWTEPIKIGNDDKGRHQFFPWITVDPSSGYIYIVYYDRNNYDDLQTDVSLSYSTDAGSSFKNVKISVKPFVPSAEVSFGDANSISASQGIITPIWTRMENGQTSIWTTVIKHEDLVKTK